MFPQSSLSKYGFKVKIIESEPTVYDECIKRCNESTNELYQFWRIRKETKTLRTIQNVKMLLFGISVNLSRSQDIDIQIIKLRNIDVLKDIRNPNNTENEVVLALSRHRKTLYNSLSELIEIYKNEQRKQTKNTHT